MSENYLVIELNHQPIELCKLLKIANLVSGGGEAKIVISEGYVLLNGELEYQKRKKVYHEDVIEFNGEVVQLIVNEELCEEDLIAEHTAQNTSHNVVNDITEQKSYALKDKPQTKAKAKAKNKPAKQAKKKSIALPQDDIIKLPRKRKPISF